MSELPSHNADVALAKWSPDSTTQLKLVIWDLDETFWAGTLSEEGIRWSNANHQVVRALSARGIVSSICSKNDARAVEQLLTSHGAWDDFVFPRIAWSPKGQMIAEIIRDMQTAPGQRVVYRR